MARRRTPKPAGETVAGLGSNGPRIVRVHEIDRRIRAGEAPNSVTLAESLEVSPRTAQRDLEFLRDRMGAPLEYDPERRGYVYTEASYALPLLEVRQGELEALDTAGRFLARLTGTSLGREAEALLQKLEAVALHRPRRAGPRPGPAETLLLVPQAPTDADVYERVRLAVRERRSMRVAHERADGQVSRRRVDPYDLVFWDGAWYAVGHCHLRNEPRIFALARLRRVEVEADGFSVPASWSLERFLAGAFSFFVSAPDAPAAQVRLRFTGYAAHYVAERRWHESQRIERHGDAAVLCLDVPVTPALERFVLGWGDEVVVESPAELGASLAVRHERAAAAQRRCHVHAVLASSGGSSKMGTSRHRPLGATETGPRAPKPRRRSP